METELKKLLKSRKITITKAAVELGIERETLHRKISGKYPFYLREAILLHRIYFSDLDFLEIFSEYAKEQGVDTPRSVDRVIRKVKS